MSECYASDCNILIYFLLLLRTSWTFEFFLSTGQTSWSSIYLWQPQGTPWSPWNLKPTLKSARVKLNIKFMQIPAAEFLLLQWLILAPSAWTWLACLLVMQLFLFLFFPLIIMFCSLFNIRTGSFGETLWRLTRNT